MPNSFLKFSLAAFALAGALHSQTPTAYTVTETTAMAGPPLQVILYRDGARALMDQSFGSPVQHTRTLFDLNKKTSVSWNVLDPSAPCGTGSFSGDWGDPFAGSAEMQKDLAKSNPTEAGTAVVAGISAKILEANTPDAKAKEWIDPRTGLILRLQLTPASGPAQTWIDVSAVSLTAPPASVFAVPAYCSAAAAPAFSNDDQRITEETGGSASEFARAIYPPATPSGACTVLIRVVHEGTLAAINSGFKLGLDLAPDISGNAHTGAVPPGGGEKDKTSELQHGVYRLKDTPKYFNLHVGFGEAGDSYALIYRQCFHPVTVLLYVVKNPAKLTDGGDWLWVKSDRFAQ